MQMSLEECEGRYMTLEHFFYRTVEQYLYIRQGLA